MTLRADLAHLKNYIEQRATPEQLKAITSSERLTLVSAGAGTGKTFTLAWRYLWALAQGAQPSEVLTLTFTEKAATEMAERIQALLSQTAELDALAGTPLGDHIRKCVKKMGEAQITTIHSYCNRLLKRWALQGGLDPQVHLLSEAQATEFWEEARHDLEMRHASVLSGDGETQRWLESDECEALLSQWSPTELLALAKEVMNAESARGLSFEQIESELAQRTALSLEALKLKVSNRLNDLVPSLLTALERATGGAVDKAKEAIAVAGLTDDPNSWSKESLEALLIADFRNKSYKEQAANLFGGVDEAKSARSEVKDLLPLIDLAQKGLCPEEEATLQALRRWCKLLWKSWEEYKTSHALLTFNDMIARAVTLAKEVDDVGRDITHLLVDEYQDTDGLQDQLVSLYAQRGVSLFLVGDVKQSIYRFRHANPALFDRRIPKGSEGLYIALQNNFRSRASVLDWVNSLFGEVFKEGVASGLTTTYEALRPGLKDAEHDESLPLGLWLFAPETDSDEKKAKAAERREALAHTLFTYLASLVGQKKVRDGEGLRPLQWGDIALLTRTRSSFEALQNKAEELGIPIVLEGQKDFYAQYDMVDLKALLQALAEPSPYSFTPPMAGFYSGLYAALPTDKAFGAVQALARGDKDWFEAEVPEAIALWNELKQASLLGAGAVISKLLGDKTWLKALKPHKAHGAIANLRHALDMIQTYEEDYGLTLPAEGRYLNLASNLDEGVPHPPSTKQNALRVMTVHASKGLEFGLVVIFDCDAKPTVKTSSLFASTPFGLGAKYNKEGKETGMAKAHQLLEAEAEAEEHARLYYVALTRARDGLICCALERQKSPKGSWLDLERSCPSHAKALEEPIAPLQGEAPQVQTDEKPRPRLVPIARKAPTRLISLSATSYAQWCYCPAAWRQINRQGVKLAWQTPHLEGERAGSKEIGLLTHNFLELWDLSQPSIDAIETYVPALHPTLQELWDKPKTQSQVKGHLTNAFAWLKETTKGKRVLREWPLEILTQREAKTLRLRGVVDLAIEEKEGLLQIIDYKTTLDSFDHQGAAHLLATYQLQFYGALAQELGYSVSELSILPLRSSTPLSVPQVKKEDLIDPAFEVAQQAMTGPWRKNPERDCALCPWRKDCTAAE